MRDLFNHTKYSIASRSLARPDEPLLTAVSGGLDSIVLLHILQELWAAPVTVAHYNHQLRGSESDADERFVVDQCRCLGLPCRVGRGDVALRAKQRGVSVEMAARELRHAFLARTAKNSRIRSIVLAHHQDDQLELFFLRLLRGSGPQGLSGMEWVSPSPADKGLRLIRPFLDVSRAELFAFASTRGIAWREDASNALPDHQRNRIRHELLPLLEREYQVGLRGKLAQTIQLIADESALIGEVAGAWLAGLLAGIEPTPAFTNLPIAIQRRVIHTQLWNLGVNPSFRLIESLRSRHSVNVSVQSGRTPDDALNLDDRQSDRIAALDKHGRVTLSPVQRPQVDWNSSRMLCKANAGRVEFYGLKLRLRVASMKSKAAAQGVAGWHVELFDADRVGPDVELRFWRAGDRFRPIGMKADKKLQDVFTDLKVPRHLRHNKVVASRPDGEIFWIEGLRIADGFRMTNETANRLIWRWKRE